MTALTLKKGYIIIFFKEIPLRNQDCQTRFPDIIEFSEQLNIVKVYKKENMSRINPASF